MEALKAELAEMKRRLEEEVKAKSKAEVGSFWMHALTLTLLSAPLLPETLPGSQEDAAKLVAQLEANMAAGRNPGAPGASTNAVDADAMHTDTGDDGVLDAVEMGDISQVVVVRVHRPPPKHIPNPSTST